MAEQEPSETQRLIDENAPPPPPPPPPPGFNNKSHFSLHLVDAETGDVVDEMGPYEWSDIYRFEEGKTYLVRTAQDQPLLTKMGNLLHFAVDLDLRTFHVPGAMKSKAKKLFSVPQDALVASTPLKENPTKYHYRQTLFGNDGCQKCLLLALHHYIEDTNDEWRRQQLPTLESDIDKVLASSLDVGPKTDGIKKSVGKILHSNIQDIRRPGTPESQANDLLTFSTYRIEGGPLYHFYIHVGTRRNKLYVPTVPFVLANTQENINSLLGKFAAADIKPHSQYTIKFNKMKVCIRCGMAKTKKNYKKKSEMCKECAKVDFNEKRAAGNAAAAVELQDQVGNNNNVNVGGPGTANVVDRNARRAPGAAERQAQVGANYNNNANLGRGARGLGTVNHGQRSGPGRNEGRNNNYNYNNLHHESQRRADNDHGSWSRAGGGAGRDRYDNRGGGRYEDRHNAYDEPHYRGRGHYDVPQCYGRRHYYEPHFGGRVHYDELHFRGRGNYDEPHYRGRGRYDYRDTLRGGYRPRSRSRSSPWNRPRRARGGRSEGHPRRN